MLRLLFFDTMTCNALTGFFYVFSGGSRIALTRSSDLVSWERGPRAFVAPDRSGDVKVSPFLGVRDQIAAGGEASASIRSDLAHPECWEFDVKYVFRLMLYLTTLYSKERCKM